MAFEKISLPKKNELPLKISESEKSAEGAESIVWKNIVQDKDKQDKLIALKQIKREQFASDGEMKKSKDFYDFLKGFPGFGKFIPDTLYFKARMSAEDKVQGYSIQRFFEGRSVDQMSDDDLYKNPEIVRQLLEFVNASQDILKKTREDKTQKPDFGTAFSSGTYAVIVGNCLVNPRYSSNIVICEKPDENGQYVFFVDTGANLDERTSETTRNIRREIAGRLQGVQLKRWAKKLKKVLDNTSPSELPNFNLPVEEQRTSQ